MPKLVMEGAREPTKGGAPAPMFEAMERRLAQEVPGLGSVNSVRDELDEINGEMKDFPDEEPDEIMRSCSGFSARLVEIRRRIHRIEDHLPHWKQVRTQEVTPLIEETRYQHEVASRILTQRKFDWEMERGS